VWSIAIDHDKASGVSAGCTIPTEPTFAGTA